MKDGLFEFHPADGQDWCSSPLIFGVTICPVNAATVSGVVAAHGGAILASAIGKSPIRRPAQAGGAVH
jgi:hypothetical protein